ncbi:DUF4132 domain-containing protein [Motilimonas cestriensis]|uniref:DUF4132 domain-containing protein n=1 Tax=Motilimonas cestriensis TaxID=2742685 RepID=UPI003DA52896
MENWRPAHQQVFNAVSELLTDVNNIRDLKDDFSGLFEGRNNKPESQCEIEQYVTQLTEKLGDNASSQLAEYLLHPVEHYIESNWKNMDGFIADIASLLAVYYFVEHPDESLTQGVIKRLFWILEAYSEGTEIAPNLYYSEADVLQRYCFPNSYDCVRFLLLMQETPAINQALKVAFSGQHNRIIARKESDYAYESRNRSSHNLLGSLYSEFADVCQRLHSNNQFDYDWFKQAVLVHPELVRSYWLEPDIDEVKADSAFSSEFIKAYSTYLKQLVEELDPIENGYALSSIFDYSQTAGISWLKKGLGLIELIGIKATDLKNAYYSDDVSKAAYYLIRCPGLLKDETQAQLIAMLGEFKEATLLTALPYAGFARDAILIALGWQSLLPVQKMLFHWGKGNPATLDSCRDVCNSTSTNSGVIDRSAASEVLAAADDKALKKYIKAMNASSIDLKNYLVLLTAVKGWDKDKLEKKLVRHHQIGIKAYGLYAVEDEAELKARYLKFKQMHKEATQYGAERQANTQAAVKAGLKNLAQSAGYSDEIRMEWALEADIADDMVAFNQEHEAEDWTVSLEMAGLKAKIVVKKAGKPLKSVPPKVRKTQIYQAMRAAQDNVRSQASRFKNTLEEMMCQRDTISADELATLSRLPVVKGMLSQLILKSGTGFGFFNGTTDTLTGLSGEAVTIVDEPVIAHVYDLLKANILPQSQQAVVSQRLVQPFKQAFRELYVVTPAEIEAKHDSMRFAGHVVDGAIASRLFQGRNWTQYGGDWVEVFKRFPKQQCYAQVEFPESRHYLAEDDGPMDVIYFKRGNDKLLLEDVEPVVFSEVMRDIDLVASVAQLDDEYGRWSTESAQRRGELVLNLIQDLGLKQVRCEDNYAYIDGKLAQYRVHLGTGVIHIQLGNYLCIVPEGQASEDLYLPFADVDKRMAEIISKIFLLISDDQIKDETILSQINQCAAQSA